MKNKLVMLFFLCHWLVFANQAQAVNDSIECKNPNTQKDTLKVDVEKLIQNFAKLAESEKTLQNEIALKNHEIRILQEKLNMIERRLFFADSIIARLSNDCLRKKYDSRNVAEAIDNFSQMHSAELQEKLSPIKKLLQKYGGYYQELINILQEAQQNPDLAIPSIGKQKTNSYILQIKKTQYYKEHYKKNWNIPFLDKLIDNSLKSLQNYDPMSMEGIILIDFK